MKQRQFGRWNLLVLKDFGKLQKEITLVHKKICSEKKRDFSFLNPIKKEMSEKNWSKMLGHRKIMVQ